ncbi:Hypothetical protein CINCED_3A018206 [Cinara cedri]|uniref:Uncharacterized protein n=1 Tax=Cinara cedri TaxID=506608 RepID=A0A5E4N8I4_9HEMI|nr:Hypothetical protein CINCED_3A018206 [Cinara cedri]
MVILNLNSTVRAGWFSPTKNLSNEDMFKNAVVEFQNGHNLRCATKNVIKVVRNNPTDDFGGVPEELISFENDLILILQQVVNLFSFKQGTSNIHFPDYVLKVCSALWRFLDYIYMYALVNRKTLLLSKMHFILCYKLPPYYNNNMNAFPDGVVVDGFIKTLNTDLSILRDSATKETLIENDCSLLNLNEKLIQNNEKFIANVFNLVSVIEKKPFMKQIDNNLYHNINSDIFQKNNLQYKSVDMHIFKSSNNFAKNDRKLENLTKNFTADVLKEKCSLTITEINEIQLDSPLLTDTMNQILLYVFEKLIYFTLYSKDNDSGETEEDVSITDRDVSIMTDKICKYIPLVIMYLVYNESNIKNWKIISLYLTFCSDYKKHTDIRCSNLFYGTTVDNITSEDKMICERESVNNIQAWTLFTTTRKELIKDKSVKKTCFKSVYAFIKESYEIIQIFYKDITLRVWVTVEWLTGKYFLTENYSNDDMNKLKFKEITVRGITMTLSEAYYLTIPWRMSIAAVLDFHHIIVYHLNSMMNMYIYRHAHIVILYLKRTVCHVENTVLKRIHESVLWHESGTEMFYKYLFLMKVMIKTAEDNTEDNAEDYRIAKDIITAISKIESLPRTNRTDCYSFIDTHIPIPEDAKVELSNWSKSELPDTANEHNLFDLVMAINCKNAMDYMRTFILIVNKSMGITIDSNEKYIKKVICSKNVFHVQPSVESISVARG